MVAAAALKADWRYLFDTLYSNRKLSIVDGYFSLSDIQQLTQGHVFETGESLETLLRTGSSRGIFLRFLIHTLDAFIYKANPNVLRANPCNIQLFMGTCPPIPPCLLCIPGTHNIYQSNGMLAESNEQRAGVSTSTRFCIGADPLPDSNMIFYSKLDGSRICSCLKKTLIPGEAKRSPCDDVLTGSMPESLPYSDDNTSKHCC